VTGSEGVPEGFTVVERPAATLIAEAALAEALTGLGLDGPAGWTAASAASASPDGPGRGAAGSLDLGGETLFLKQLRRGGMLARLWRQRHAGRRRLLDNLTVPLAVARRGIATAAPVALLLVQGPPGLYRGWLATRRIAGARDLAQGLASPSPPGSAVLATVLALVRRMHDAGVEHPDLNLGNLLWRSGPAGPEAFVVDLDRVRLRDAPLSFRRRQRAVRRLERSYLKRFGDRADAPDWYGLYAADTPELARRFAHGRPAGRLLLLLHRLGWRG